jgi:hypothetical protein
MGVAGYDYPLTHDEAPGALPLLATALRAPPVPGGIEVIPPDEDAVDALRACAVQRGSGV